MIYKKDKVFAESALDNSLSKMRRVLMSILDDTYGAESYKAVFAFLAVYPQEFLNYKIRFLLPDLGKFQQIVDFLSGGEGERFWIQFQQREDSDLLPKTRGIIKGLNSYISDMERGPQSQARAVRRNLSYLEKQLLLSDSFPGKELLDILLKSEISFNVVFWGSLKGSDSNPTHDEAFDLEGLLRKISSDSGGKTVVTTQPEKGLREIENYSNQFYELFYDYNGKIEEKKIHVSTGVKEIKLLHRDEFSQGEMKSLIQYLSKEKVKISDFSLKENTIAFSLRSFKRDKIKNYGLLKVRISFFNEQGKNVLKCENVMRATKDRVVISFPIPELDTGKYRLVISIYDLTANSLASDQHLINLD